MSFEGRRVSEPSALRALSHPLRLRIIELLEQAGPLTATEAAAHLGTTPSNCSFHLRLLARHGFIAEADGATGRNRPWRRVDAHVSVDVDELDQDARDAVPMLIGAGADRLRTNGLRWFAARESYSQEWRNAAGDLHLVIDVTAAELTALRRAIDDLVAPYRRSKARDRVADTEPVALVFSALPLARPASRRSGAQGNPESRQESTMPDPASADTDSAFAAREPLPFDRYVPERRFQQSVAISPDGTTVAYVANDGGQYNLWLRPLAGGEARRLTTFTDHSVRVVAWAPDGASLAFAADHDGDEQFQILRITTTGGDPGRLTSVPDRQFDLGSTPFSRDGTLLVYAGNDRDESVQDLLVHDLPSDTVRRVKSEPGEVAESVAVSPDGRWLLATIARSNTDFDTAVVDLADPDGAIQLLTPHEGEAVYIPCGWLPDSSAVYVITDTGGEFRSLATCGLDGRITPFVAPDWDVEQVVPSADGSTLVWAVNEAGTSVPYRRDADGVPGGGASRITIPDGVLGAFDVTPDGATIAGLFGSATRPTELVAIDVASGGMTYLTDSRPPALRESKPIEPIAVDYPTHDGRRIPAWLYRPAGRGPHPVVLSIHGGPEAQERAEYAYSGLYQYLLANGVGVLAPNVRGSTGYGVSYQKLIHRDWGGGELGDFEHAVKYLHSVDWVDADRIAVFGGSFGGFATLSCVSRLPDLFAAGVSLVGPSNLVTLTRSVPPTWRPLMASWVGDPDDDFDMLMERSPISYVDQIAAPLMIIQGANDPRVVKAESDQIVEALRGRGVDVRYDVYDDEGHGFTKRSNEIKAIGDIAGFLVAHLRWREPNRID